MLNVGKAVKVAIYLTDGATHRGVAASSSILDFLFYRGVSGATVLKGVAGFGAEHRMHSASFVEISDQLPVKIEFIESAEKVGELLPRLEELAGSGIIEVQETSIVKTAQLASKDAPPVTPAVKIEGPAKIMNIHIGEDDRWNGKPLYQALVEAMRANDLAGATVYRGILGYGAHRRIHRDKPFHLSHDASIMLSVIDTEEKLRAFLPMVEQMVQEGIVVFCDAEVIKYSHRAPEAEPENQDAENQDSDDSFDPL
jgi:PII-like signaling protein